VVSVPKVNFHYDPHHDTNDGKEWSEMDIEDLKASVAHGGTLEETASHLCRAGTQFEVAEKAKELGLRWQNGRGNCAKRLNVSDPYAAVR
jgi:hypothetical protein